MTINGPPTPIDRERRPLVKCGVFVMHRSEEAAQVDGNMYARKSMSCNSYLDRIAFLCHDAVYKMLLVIPTHHSYTAVSVVNMLFRNLEDLLPSSSQQPG